MFKLQFYPITDLETQISDIRARVRRKISEIKLTTDCVTPPYYYPPTPYHPAAIAASHHLYADLAALHGELATVQHKIVTDIGMYVRCSSLTLSTTQISLILYVCMYEWKDFDKKYSNIFNKYFQTKMMNKITYTITMYKSSLKGFQEISNTSARFPKCIIQMRLVRLNPF